MVPLGRQEPVMMNLRMLLMAALMFLLPASVAARAPLSIEDMRQLAGSKRLLDKESYLRSARGARAIFLQQGGLVELDPALPTIVLPDLHAQRDYLLQVLQLRRNNSSVFEQLSRGKLNVLCLGDAMHSEREVARWMQAEQDYLRGAPSPSLEAELVDSLGLLKMVMELKQAFPRNFYFVRGNHEDMDPLRPYRKFTQVGESTLVLQWVKKNLGEPFLREWHACELAMPLVARGGSFVGSHAPPETVLTLQAIKDRTEGAFRACCWSDNTQWRTGSAEERAFEQNCKLLGVTAARPWLCGHRKVVGALYREQCGGKLVQFNPLDSAARIVVFAPARGFRAARDVQVLSLP